MQEVLENIEVSKLPSFPHVLVKLLEACQRPDATISTLSTIVDKDAALSAKVIAAANSPLYGLRNPVRSLERTLVVLGLDTIKTIAIASAVHQFFANLSADRGAFLKSFWRHSMRCATLARNLATLSGYPNRDEAYMAGLLHDVGKLVLAQRYADKYGAVQTLADEHHDLVAQEREHFGIAHHEVGFWLIRNWHLDSFLAEAVLHHHEPSPRLIESHPLVRIVHVANLWAESDVLGNELGAQAAQTLFGLTFEMSAEQVRQAGQEVAKVAASLDIDVSEADSYEHRQAVQAQDAAVLDRLAAEVRNIGLLDGVRRQLGRVSGASTLDVVRESVRMLFDVPRPLLFLVSDDATQVRGQPFGSDDTLVAEVEFPVASEQSLVSQAVRERRSFASFDESAELSIVDRQIAHLAQQDGLLCIPVLSAGAGAVVGVLVLGVGDMQGRRFARQRGLLESFGAEVARALEANRMRERERRDSAEECRSQFEARARALVHEANNPLAIMQNYLHLLSEKLEQHHPAQADLTIIREEIERVGTMLRRMSESGADAQSEGELDLNRVTEDLVRVFQRSLFEPAGIQATMDLDRDIPVLASSRSAFKQILVNLLKNAAEALQSGGTIAIATRDHVNFNGADFVEILVADSGPGIPEPILETLFQPVQSTKGAQHSGLGLAIVHSLVKELGGMISCRSDNTGTRFQVLLPRVVE